MKTHDDLRAEFKLAGLTEAAGMNLLQGEAPSTVISDYCLKVSDIAQDNLEAAVRWMKNWNEVG